MYLLIIKVGKNCFYELQPKKYAIYIQEQVYSIVYLLKKTTSILYVSFEYYLDQLQLSEIHKNFAIHSPNFHLYKYHRYYISLRIRPSF